jgi:hypothetical protein
MERQAFLREAAHLVRRGQVRQMHFAVLLGQRFL